MAVCVVEEGYVDYVGFESFRTICLHRSCAESQGILVASLSRQLNSGRSS
jgi:hypothetical protein